MTHATSPTQSRSLRASADAYRSTITSRLSFVGSIRGEWIKLRSLKSTYIIMIFLLLMLPAAAALMSFSYHYALTQSDVESLTLMAVGPEVYWACVLGGLQSALIIAGIFGVIAVSAEYTTMSVQSSLTANPRRPMLLTAKLVVTLLVTLVCSLLSVLAAWGVTALIFDGMVPMTNPMATAMPFSSIFGSAFAITCFAAIGFGFGALFRSTIGGVLAVIILCTVVPMMVTLAATYGGEHVSWILTIDSLLPTSLVPSLTVTITTEAPSKATIFSAATPVFDPNWWQSILILCAWVAVLVAAGYTSVIRTDVKG